MLGGPTRVTFEIHLPLSQSSVKLSTIDPEQHANSDASVAPSYSSIPRYYRTLMLNKQFSAPIRAWTNLHVARSVQYAMAV